MLFVEITSGNYIVKNVNQHFPFARRDLFGVNNDRKGCSDEESSKNLKFKV